MKAKPKTSAKPAGEAESKAQVKKIVEAAEETATKIIAEAEAKAAAYVEETQLRTDEAAAKQAQDIWTLTDTLIARAEAVKDQSDELLRALNQTKRGVEAATSAKEAEQAPAPSAKPAKGARGRAKPPDEEASKPAAKAPAAKPVPEQLSEGARLLATQMAVAGSSRDEITSRLRNDFGIADAESMLDAILGARQS